MNQEYRGRVKRWLDSGGDPKYVNVKRKSEARHKAIEKAKGGKKDMVSYINEKGKKMYGASARSKANTIPY